VIKMRRVRRYLEKRRLEKAKKVVEKRASEFLARENTVGVGVGIQYKDGKEVGRGVVVLLSKKLPESQLEKKDIHPKKVDGLRVDCIETGEFVALGDPRRKIRPIQPGISVGNCRITAGTIGMFVRYANKQTERKKDSWEVDVLVKENSSNRPMLLSNAHVLCSDPFKDMKDQALDIYQPGPYDGGDKSCRIGELHRYVKLEEEFPAFGDRALAVIDEGIELDPRLFNLDVPLEGFTEPELGMKLGKVGRTTGFTTGKITAVNATIKVLYGGGKVVTFKEVFIADVLSRGGDSGSPCFNPDTYESPGILFAGSETHSAYTDIRHCTNIWPIELIKPEPKERVYTLLIELVPKEQSEDWIVKGSVISVKTKRPIPNVEVSLDQRSVITDASGRFEFREVPPGKHLVKAVCSGYEPYEKEIVLGD